MGRRGAGAQRSAAAWQRGGGALHSRGAERITGSPERITGRAGSIGAARSPGRAWQQQGGRSPGRARQHRGGAIPRQGVGSIGAVRSPGRAWPASGRRDPLAGRGSIGAARSPRQGVAASGRRDPPAGRASSRAGDPPAGRASSWQQIHRQQGGQGLRAAKSSRAKDESPTGILSTHVHVAAEKNFFTPRRGVILAEKRPFPARSRKPCYDFCVGRGSPPAKQKLHSADHGAERISP